MTNQQNEITIDLGRLFKALWKRVWIIAIVSVISGVLAFCGSVLFITPKYEASVMFYIFNKETGDIGSQISASDLQTVEKLANTYTQIIMTPTSLNMIKDRSGADVTITELKKMISASALNATSVYEIKIESDDPNEAADIANAIAAIMPDHVINIIGGGIMNVLDRATVPDEPVSPNIPMNTVIGFFIGFIVICGIVIIREITDDKIKDSDYLTQTYELPVLAVIPDLMAAQAMSTAYHKAAQENNKR